MQSSTTSSVRHAWSACGCIEHVDIDAYPYASCEGTGYFDNFTRNQSSCIQLLQAIRRHFGV